jgi:hypothetical protein
VSKVSVIPLGGLNDLLYVLVKNPTMTSPGTVVVTDGATGFRVDRVNAPLCESIGVVASTFLKSRIAAVADDVDASDQL